MELSNPKKYIMFGGAAALILGTLYFYTQDQNHENLAAGKIFQDCDECPSMIVVPAGSFMMGSPETEKGRTNLRIKEEQHRVEISNPFAIGRFEITVGQIRAFLSETGYSISETGSNIKKKCVFPRVRGGVKFSYRYSFEAPGFKQTNDHPAVCVSWDDAQAYLKWLTKKSGRKYRLPTESEWEYAARAGSKTPYWWGDELTTDKANYIEAHYGQNLGEPNKVHESGTMPVDSFSPNKFGLYNVHGNVGEWTQDCWHSWEAGYQGHPTDGSAWLEADNGNCKHRIVRNAGWLGIPQLLRSANRSRGGVDTRDNSYGFRVVRDLAQ